MNTIGCRPGEQEDLREGARHNTIIINLRLLLLDPVLDRRNNHYVPIVASLAQGARADNNIDI